VPEEVSRFLATTAEVQLVEEDETMTWRAQIRTDSGRTQSLHADTLSSRTRGADAPARHEGAPAKRPREGDSAAEVDARRSFVTLYAPSVGIAKIRGSLSLLLGQTKKVRTRLLASTGTSSTSPANLTLAAVRVSVTAVLLLL
jgi:hypothetical protein